MFKKVDKFLSCGGFQILSFLVAASISTSCSRNTVYYSLEKKKTKTQKTPPQQKNPTITQKIAAYKEKKNG